MQKFKILFVAAISAVLITSCGMNNTGTRTPSNNNAGSNLGNDVKDMGNAVSDTAGDAVNNVTNAVDDLTGTNNNNNNNTANK